MKFNITLKRVSLFFMALTIPCACGGGRNNLSTGSGNTNADAVPSVVRQAVTQYTYVVKNIYPHNGRSYTQGLYWHDGYLWEGTGQHGESALKQVDLTSGKILKEVELDDKYFGEGIALLDGKIYQLTWLDHIGFIYDAGTLKQTGEFKYAGEGWGLTTDGKKLYMSNGTNEIQVINPDGFKQESVIRVTLNNKRVKMLNELEWIDGKIWANVYESDSVMIIDPETGKVEGVVDFTGILPDSDKTIWTDVFNGIAYDAETGRIFVTGKNWSKLFEIELKEK